MEPFAYPRESLALTVRATETRNGATIEDVSFAGADAEAVSAYLVLPRVEGEPAVLYMHMLGGDNDRTQFLDEGVELAGAGVASLHVQGRFPWADAPREIDHDRRLIAQEVVGLRRGLDVLDRRLGHAVRPTAFVGHDYGAMYGAIVASVDARISAAVLIAGHPHFATWFEKYWELGDNAGPGYMAGFADLDPVRFLARGRPIPLLLQFAEDDEFVSESERDEFVQAAPQPRETRLYEGDHHLTAEATAERIGWLLGRLTEP